MEGEEKVLGLEQKEMKLADEVVLEVHGRWGLRKRLWFNLGGCVWNRLV